MKVSELALALNEVGKAYRHAKKNEPAPCIIQLLKFLHGKEQLDVKELVDHELDKKSRTKEFRTKKPNTFKLDDHLKALDNARGDTEFKAAMELLKKAKPTNDDLKRLILAYTGVSQKNGKKDDLWNALEVGYNTKRRIERREKIASETLPI